MQRVIAAPVTDKNTEVYASRTYYVASSQMQGWRPHMEDFTANFIQSPDDPNCVFLAIYDGHGGTGVANYLRTHLHKYIMKSAAYKRGEIGQALKQGYLALDSKMQRDIRFRQDISGSTAVTIFIKNQKLYCGNAGDSVAIALVGNEARTLTVLHRPYKKPEHQRINNAGYAVHFNRLDNDLAVSRGFGDFRYKRNRHLPAEAQAVSCEPSVCEATISRDIKFVILASDGITEVMTAKQIVEFIQRKMEEGELPEAIIERLMDFCLSRNSTDNMTATLIIFMRNVSFEYWQKMMGARKSWDTASGKKKASYGTASIQS